MWLKPLCLCYFHSFFFQGVPVPNPCVYAIFRSGRKGLGTYLAKFWRLFRVPSKVGSKTTPRELPGGEVLEPGGSLGDPMGPPGEPLGAPLGTLETPLGAPWAHLGTFGEPLGSRWEPLGSRWVPFGSLWDFL